VGREERKLKKHFEQKEKDQLRKLAQKGLHDRATDRPKSSATRNGLVVEVGPGGCRVHFEDRNLRCNCRFDVAVGDRVLFSETHRRVEEILPRSTVLSRPDPHNPRVQRIIAANIDLVVNVVSIESPPLRPGLIDRYLIAIEASGAEPLICVNKIDLGGSGAELQPYRDLGIPVIECSAATGAGMEQLRSALTGKLCVFTGHSGVGKSSLLNALAPEADAATGDVSEAHGKGRHTTTGSRLYELEDGAVIIDTPGIREFGLWDIPQEEVRLYFHEFDAFAVQCGFGDCTHTHEPRCAVKEAVEAERIPRPRYESYLRIIS
jgi:ribosome biogenesis GTPase